MFLSAFPLADKAHRHIQIPSKDCLARPLSLPKIHNDGWRHLLDRGETLFIEMMHSHLIDDSCIMQVRHHLMHGCHSRTAVLLRHIFHLHLLAVFKRRCFSYSACDLRMAHSCRPSISRSRSAACCRNSGRSVCTISHTSASLTVA